MNTNSAVERRLDISQCTFCDEFENGNDRIIWSDDEWVVVPAVGAFVAGYCLLLSAACVRSFSHIPTAQLIGAGEVVEKIRQTISNEYGRPVIVAEHGVDASCPYLSSACCTDHNHLHFIPLPEGVRPEDVEKMYVRVGGGTPRQLGALRALASYEQAYLFLSPSPGRYLTWTWNEGFGKQFARRVVAGLGNESRWDWQSHQFKENMQTTVDVLRKCSRPW